MDKDLYGILLLDSRLRGNDNNEKSISYGRHPSERLWTSSQRKRGSII
jgi:hypothetical protein